MTRPWSFFLPLCVLAAHTAAATVQMPGTGNGGAAGAETAGERPALIPYPKQVRWYGRTAVFDRLLLADGAAGMRETEQEWLRQEWNSIGGKAGTAEGSGTACRLELRRLDGAAADARAEEEYKLQVTGGGAVLSARGFPGFFNGLQTFRQLLAVRTDGKAALPEVDIEDRPAFAVRGVMLDVGRYYLSPGFLKETVRRLSQYKVNVLHLHLTDDPAWRVEIPGLPQLTAAANHWPARLPGKCYSLKELSELVAYCRTLNVRVIPEIDMPGHSRAFSRAMGFGMQSEAGVAALKKIVDAVAPVFPDAWFHLGGDETRITRPGFMAEMAACIHGKGREVILWHPGVPVGGTIAMCWGENESGAKLDRSRRFIDCNGFYLDWMDAQSGVFQVFFQQPCEQAEGDASALGAVMPVWFDGALGGERRVLEQYPFYPCALTFAERVWRGRAQKQLQYMAQLPPKGSAEWREFAEFEARLVRHRDRCFQDLPFAYVRQADMQWRLIGPFDHQGRNDAAFPPEREILPAYTVQGKTRQWLEQPVTGGAVHIRHFFTVFNMHRNQYRLNYWPTALSEAVGNGGGTCYALTYVRSPAEQEVFLMFGANGMWGHSGGYRSARAPEQGSWDFSGGDVWINDRRVAPPHWPFKSLPWTGWGKGRIEEAPLTWEGYFFRPPVRVTLRKGMNKILVKSVFGHWKGDDGERKWFFCCIPVRWDGRQYREVEGLEYLPLLPAEREANSPEPDLQAAGQQDAHPPAEPKK